MKSVQWMTSLFILESKNAPLGPTKIRCSKITHLRVGQPFSCISLDGNNFSSLFNQREIDEESNTSGFIFFEALLN